MDDRYLAGLMDGEGCIGTTVRPPLSFKITVQFGMANCALPLIIKIHQQYGGILKERKLSKKNPLWSDQTYIYWIAQDDVRELLVKIEPYLELKREQAKLVLWWLDNVRPYSNQYGLDEARVYFVDNLRWMKTVPYYPAAEVIKGLEQCFNPRLRVVNNG